MAKETLTCQTGNHKWSREATRGRKPAFCPKHKPAVIVNRSTTDGVQHLHCAIGNHDWERPSVRGVKPNNCPEHKPAVTVPAHNSTVTTQPNGMVLLHCETGDHDWEREPKRGRKPTSCPAHSGPRDVGVRVIQSDNLAPNEVILSEDEDGSAMVLILDDAFYESLPKVEAPVKRGPGRPRIHETPEEAKEADLEKSRKRTEELELSLKARGTHLSQQTPYILYKKTSEDKARERVVWDKVAEHSPLAREQFLNEHDAEMRDGLFRYERVGELIPA